MVLAGRRGARGPRPARRWTLLVFDLLRPGRLGCGLFLLGVFLLGALAALVAEQLFLAPDPAITRTAGLPPSDQNPDLRVTLSAGLLAALIQQSVDQGQAPVTIENVRVETEPGRLTIRGNIPVAGRTVPGSVDLAPDVVDQRLVMRVLDAQLGPLAIPRDLGRLVEGPLNSRVADATSGLPASITAATVDASGLTVIARVNPAGTVGPAR